MNGLYPDLDDPSKCVLFGCAQLSDFRIPAKGSLDYPSSWNNGPSCEICKSGYAKRADGRCHIPYCKDYVFVDGIPYPTLCAECVPPTVLIGAGTETCMVPQCEIQTEEDGSPHWSWPPRCLRCQMIGDFHFTTGVSTSGKRWAIDEINGACVPPPVPGCKR